MAGKSCLLLSLGLLVGCTSDMQSARRSLDSADRAMSVVAPDASLYEPDKLAVIQNQLVQLHAAFAARQYATVVSEALSLSGDTSGLAAEVADKKQDAMSVLTVQWDETSVAVPQLMSVVRTRVGSIGKIRGRLRGINLSAARSALSEASSLWDTAQTFYLEGKLPDAEKTAKEAAGRLDQAARALKIELAQNATA